ncbi:hypothetical protein ACHAWF_011952 [Thalassiosira exigua]
MVLENFKSYAGIRTIGPFHKCFSSVVGPNGSGKSNVIDAMLFVFGKRAKKLRLNKVSELIHSSDAYEGENRLSYAKVSVHFAEIVDTGDGDDDYDVVSGSEVVISRVARRDNSSQYQIDGRGTSFKKVAEFLGSKGIDLDNNRFLILQGEVSRVESDGCSFVWLGGGESLSLENNETMPLFFLLLLLDHEQLKTGGDDQHDGPQGEGRGGRGPARVPGGHHREQQVRRGGERGGREGGAPRRGATGAAQPGQGRREGEGRTRGGQEGGGGPRVQGPRGAEEAQRLVSDPRPAGAGRGRGGAGEAGGTGCGAGGGASRARRGRRARLRDRGRDGRPDERVRGGAPGADEDEGRARGVRAPGHPDPGERQAREVHGEEARGEGEGRGREDRRRSRRPGRGRGEPAPPRGGDRGARGREGGGGRQARGGLRGGPRRHRDAPTGARGEDGGAGPAPARADGVSERPRHGPGGGELARGRREARRGAAGEERGGAELVGRSAGGGEGGVDSVREGVGGGEGAGREGGGGAAGVGLEGEGAVEEEHRAPDPGRGGPGVRAIHRGPLSRRHRHPQGLQEGRGARVVRRHGTSRRLGRRRPSTRRRRLHGVRDARPHRRPDHGGDAALPRVPAEAQPRPGELRPPGQDEEGGARSRGGDARGGAAPVRLDPARPRVDRARAVPRRGEHAGGSGPRDGDEVGVRLREEVEGGHDGREAHRIERDHVGGREAGQEGRDEAVEWKEGRAAGEPHGGNLRRGHPQARGAGWHGPGGAQSVPRPPA